ncbi:hypothetical protein MHFGQ_10470 [Moorella humiferrea]|uniref:Uncharacterized protein n=1 Tax=Neomoorella humiferrea TaxID=676965 RepID=A0A2T0AUM5_9FIRM|nr:hypothetical protein MOHU_09150 [Moorella humiferrea]
MCFRPTAISRKIKCPSCGKEVTIFEGIKQKKCPHCKADLETAGQK